jgi:stress-induced morphogen
VCRFVPKVRPAGAATIRLVPTATDSLRELLEQAFPDATELDVRDRTGSGDHFHVTVASSAFAGLSLVEQHRLIYAALATPLGDGTIHELRISTKGPNE